jgi:hypothetical protein
MNYNYTVVSQYQGVKYYTPVKAPRFSLYKLYWNNKTAYLLWQSYAYIFPLTNFILLSDVKQDNNHFFHLKLPTDMMVETGCLCCIIWRTVTAQQLGHRWSETHTKWIKSILYIRKEGGLPVRGQHYAVLGSSTTKLYRTLQYQVYFYSNNYTEFSQRLCVDYHASFSWSYNIKWQPNSTDNSTIYTQNKESQGPGTCIHFCIQCNLVYWKDRKSQWLSS